MDDAWVYIAALVPIENLVKRPVSEITVLYQPHYMSYQHSHILKLIPLFVFYPAMLHEQSNPCFKSCRHLAASGFPPATETTHFHKSAVTWKPERPCQSSLETSFLV